MLTQFPQMRFLVIVSTFQVLSSYCIALFVNNFYFCEFKINGFLEILQSPSKLERFPECLNLLLSQCQSFACVEFNMASDMLVCCLLHYTFMLE